MTAQDVTTSRSSRRAMLMGALGGIGAWAAGALGAATRVRAADDDPMLVGGEYISSSVTSLTNTTNNERVFQAQSDGAGTAVFAQSDDGDAIFANAGLGRAVVANTNGEEALDAHSDSDTAAAIRGVQGSDPPLTGVLGVSGDFIPLARQKTGVHGICEEGVSSRGVFGESSTGHGVHGETVSGSAVYGTADTGYAIRGSGRIRFERVSGTARIAAGATKVTVNPGAGVSRSAFVLLTPKSNIGARSLWFTTDPTGDRFTVHISSARSSTTFVAWLLVG